MRLSRDEDCRRGTELAPHRSSECDSESILYPLDVARGRNDGGGIFLLAGSVIHLQREFRSSSDSVELRRRRIGREGFSARTCKPSTMARGSAGYYRRCAGVLGQKVRV
jgi:hypothetical protein